jgi:cephalosporin-C deacetylase
MLRVAADQYVSKVRMPEGIDLFWGEDLAETEKNPLEPEVVHDPLRSTEQIDVHEVFLTSLDRVRIAGWYAAPREREGKLPGLLQVPGYNMEPPAPKVWARKG